MSIHRKGRGAIILSGGLSSRFGSNKALQALGDKPLIRHMIDRVTNVVDEVVVVLGRAESRDKYDTVLPPRVRVVNDDRGGKNPLVGIVAGLGSIQSEYGAILACDAPFVNSEVIEFLFRQALNANAAIPRWSRGKIEPLQAVYRRVPALRAGLETLTPPNLSIKDMIAKLERIVYVSVEDEIAGIDRELTTFFNINTREDFAIAEGMLAGLTRSLEHEDQKPHQETRTS